MNRKDALLATFIALSLTLGAISIFEYNQSTSPYKQTTCTITGQPGPFLLRVVSDSYQTPIIGAAVNATNKPMYCDGGPANNQTALVFSTNSTEWYSLGSENNAGYSLVVNYSGQSFSFTADLRPVSVTCATLYIPSGETNVTILAFQTTCP
jgi:hypothetical protein